MLNIDEFEVLELAAYLCSIDEDDYPKHLVAEDDPEDIETEEFEEAVEISLWEIFNIDLDTFTNLVSKLLPLCLNAPGVLTGYPYIGFAADGLWLLKMVKSDG